MTESSSTMKERGNSVRTFDDDGYKRRAACLVFKDNSEREVLLVSCCGLKQGRWIVPGGGVEPYEDFIQTAVREVKEEAGVLGKLGRCLGVFENRERKTRTSVFCMIMTELLEDWEDRVLGRERRWFTIDDARHQLSISKPVQGRYLDLITSNQSNSGGAVT